MPGGTGSAKPKVPGTRSDTGGTRRLRRFLYVVVFLALCAAGTHRLSRLTERPDSEYKYQPFFTEDTDYDVLFFGTSHVMNAIFPMQLWEDYGITSYNWGSDGNSIASSYWLMRNVVRLRKPRIAVLDVSWAESQTTKLWGVDFAHKSYDILPLTPAKVAAIRDIYHADKAAQAQLLFPFITYHDRWPELTQADLKKTFRPLSPVTPEKGAESRVRVAKHPVTIAKVPKDTCMEEETLAMGYIRRFVEYCRAHDITPILTFVPYPAPDYRQIANNSVARLAAEMDVPFLNMLDADLIDVHTDMYDKDSHLNPSGARKVTDYLGRYLTEEMGLASHKDDPAYASLWNADYETYRSFLKQEFKDQQKLTSCLMLLNNENFTGKMQTTAAHRPGDAESRLITALGDNLQIDTIYLAAAPGEQPESALTSAEQPAAAAEVSAEQPAAATDGSAEQQATTDENSAAQNSQPATEPPQELFENPDAEYPEVVLTIYDKRDGSIVIRKEFTKKDELPE